MLEFQTQAHPLCCNLMSNFDQLLVTDHVREYAGTPIAPLLERGPLSVGKCGLRRSDASAGHQALQAVPGGAPSHRKKPAPGGRDRLPPFRGPRRVAREASGEIRCTSAGIASCWTLRALLWESAARRTSIQWLVGLLCAAAPPNSDPGSSTVRTGALFGERHVCHSLAELLEQCAWLWSAALEAMCCLTGHMVFA